MGIGLRSAGCGQNGRGGIIKKPESLTPPTIEIHISEVLRLEPDRAILTRFCGGGGSHLSGAFEPFFFFCMAILSV